MLPPWGRENDCDVGYYEHTAPLGQEVVVTESYKHPAPVGRRMMVTWDTTNKLPRWSMETDYDVGARNMPPRRTGERR